ncbi:unnamed protein product [Rotaria socialis]|uniref:Solute carrier family 46 member 3-like n=1 Tax=Rotaria socialis TaxID=392032 RepID=A0A820UBI6_9BILA|nr:unnamed protein product [Rotaria socialis]CAF4485006.1 unnamed protein product [Rotaria socialis]
MNKKDNNDNESEPLIKVTYPRWWRGLPSLLIMMIISNIDVLILNDFIEYHYAKVYQVNSTSSEIRREICLNESSSSSAAFSTTTSKSPIATTTSLSNLVQAATARLNVYIYLSATVPAIITSILLGANCDRIGRKSLIALPFVGKITRYIILSSVVYFDLSEWLIILAVMCDGLCGAASLCILSAFAYVADCTTAKNRTPATIIANISIASSRILPLITLGLYLKSHHFIVAMLMALGLSIFGFIFTLIFQPESNVKARKLNILQQLTQVRLAPVKNILKVYFVKRLESKQRRLLINIGTHLGFIVMLCGHVAIFFLYLYGSPFCFDSFRVGILTVVQISTAVLLTIPFTLTIAKRTDSLFIPMIGCLCYMTQFLILGTTKYLWMLYLGVCIGSIFFVTTPIIRSRISKLVEPNEYAIVFILASIFESAGYYAISAFTNEIYRLSVSFDSGFVFFTLAFVGILPLVFMTYLFIVERRLKPPPIKPTTSINE